MCDRRTLVPIPALLWKAGAISQFDPDHPEYGIDDTGRQCLAIDSCIVPAVRALWAAGIVTISCCCLHGEGYGTITLARAMQQAEQTKGRPLIEVFADETD